MTGAKPRQLTLYKVAACATRCKLYHMKIIELKSDWLMWKLEYIAELARTKKVLNFPHISYPSFDDEGTGIWGQDEH